MDRATEVLGQRLFTVMEYDRMVEAGVLAGWGPRRRGGAHPRGHPRDEPKE